LEEGAAVSGRGAFLATLIAFFLVEIGDKTQVATVALAAGYSSLAAVVAGTTGGMLIANAPVVFMGKVFADRLPMRAIHRGAAGLFALLGVLFIARALMG
jgi:putative Ca2+/H+ antiporter (TMEM165/GDT1 family)